MRNTPDIVDPTMPGAYGHGMHSVDDTTDAMIRSVLALTENRLRLNPVPMDRASTATHLTAVTEGLINEEGTHPDQVLGVWTSQLAPAILSADSPGFLGFIPAAPTKASLLFDMMVSCASIQGISWMEASGAIHAENQVLRWIADLAGFPASAGGAFVSGGSAANLSALAVARDTAKRRAHETGVTVPRWRIACSSEAHSSITNALNLLEMDALVVPSADHRFTGEALRAALEADPNPESIAAIVATSGTTNAGIVDDLAGLSSVAQERGIWFHVDGAYGGAGLLATSVRHLYNGIEHADSFIVDPHKWLFAPFDCAALLYRNPALAKSVHTQDASYLDVIHDDQPADGWNPTDYAHHLTRRARGLPLWFSLAVNGVRAYREAVEAGLTLAREAAKEIASRPYLELIRDPELSVVLWRRTGWSASDYSAWADKLLDDQIAFIPPTSWEGETVARFAFLHPQTSLDLVRTVLDRMA